MDYQTIRFEKRDGIGYLTLHRPDKLNAISRDMLAELRHVLSAIDTDEEVRVVILTGAGRAFLPGLTLARRATARRSTNSMRMSGGNTSRKISRPS